MSRYIDAESLASKVKKHLNPHTDEFGMVSVENADRWFLSLIENEPDVNAVVLPCSIGTMVYRIARVGDPETGYDQIGVKNTIFDLGWYDQLGKTVFVTKEEAEAKWEELGDKGRKELLRWL